MTPNNDNQVITFSSDYPNSEYRFLEANQEILDQIKNNKKLVIKGSLKDEAVLCTDDKTFAIRAGHTSNSMLLISKDSNKIKVALQYHLELTEIQPKLNVLKDLLYSKAINNSLDFEDDESSLGFSFDEIIDRIQSSEKEIQQYLSKLNTLIYKNRYIILSEHYEFKILELILSEATIGGWNLDSIPIDKCMENIRAPEFILKHCLQLYSKQKSSLSTTNEETTTTTTTTTTTSNENICSLDFNKICIFRAKQLLTLSTKSNMKFEEFMDNWKDTLPVGIQPNFSMLKGIAILITSPTNPKEISVKFIDESTLPSIPKARFKELFQISTRWTIDDIEPFIKPTIPPGNSLEQFILTYSRPITTSTGEKMIVTRF
ncbi:hypothetical protein RB653_009817 [Dictyostelium firmibasis]|uniref:Sister chromatid cohesion protein DCC1 n=1 Tax=Dictyostelium firmibasis TaxID=79012 RepID=A0AAN7YKG2_9MYCE